MWQGKESSWSILNEECNIPRRAFVACLRLRQFRVWVFDTEVHRDEVVSNDDEERGKKHHRRNTSALLVLRTIDDRNLDYQEVRKILAQLAAVRGTWTDIPTLPSPHVRIKHYVLRQTGGGMTEEILKRLPELGVTVSLKDL